MESGKPLSPLLFCLAEEVLSRYISHAAETGDLIPIRAGRQTRVPTHLLYADDILLFCQASSRNCQSLSRIFEHYASISGQCVNYTKSKIFFGSQVPQALRRRIKRSIGFSEGSLPFIYLGVPLFTGKPRRIFFQPVMDKILSKFSRWRGSSLSMVGRVCLVDSVIASSLVHSMMIYKWPSSLLKDIEAAMRNFIWTGDIRKRGFTSVAWARVCSPKEEGGLGLRSISTANRALPLHLGFPYKGGSLL